MKAATLVRLTVLIGTVFLAGCNAPHSEEAEDNAAADPPPPVVVTAVLTAAKDAEKLEGVATTLEVSRRNLPGLRKLARAL